MSTGTIESPKADTPRPRSSPTRDKFAQAKWAKKKVKRLQHRKAIRRSHTNG